MKTKTLLMFILTVISILTVVTALTACSHQHEYTTTIVEPTCTAQGYTIYTCECGHSYNDNYVDVLGHKFTNYVYNDDATYEEDGTETAICDREGCEEKETVTAPNTKLASSITFKTLTVDGKNVYSTVTNFELFSGKRN